MADFNPSSTGTKGVEWLPAVAPTVVIDSASKSACMSLLQTTSQAIGTARVYLGSIPQRGGLYVLEVFDDENAVPASYGALNVTALPNEDVSIGSWAGNIVNTAGNRYQNIDEGQPVSVADHIRTTTNLDKYTGRLNTGSLSLTGLRVCSLRLNVACVNVLSLAYFIEIGLNISGTDYGATFQPGNVGSFQLMQKEWEYNPATKKPWTIADVQAFDTSDEYYITAQLTPPTTVYVFAVYLEVVLATESRLAFGTLDDTASALTADAWNAATLLTPTGGTWTKDGAGRHLYLLRRINATGQLVVPHLDSGVEVNPARSFTPFFTSSFVPGVVASMGDPMTKVFGLIQRTTAPAESVDSQPYVLQVEAKAYNGQDAEQEHTTAALTYGKFAALVKPNGAVGTLSVRLKRRSDNAVIAGPVTLTVAEAAALPDQGNGWKLLDLADVAAVAATAAQHYVEFSDANASDDGTGTKYWSVLTLDTADQGNGAGYGGTTDRALVNGSEADRYDLAGTLQTVPTVPANFVVVIDEDAVTGDGTNCEVTTLEVADATWSATSLSGSFSQYQVDRSIGGGDWERVAELELEATVAWSDTEAPRGIESCYRIRVVRTDGATSAWSVSDCVTPHAVNCEWAFTSNIDSTLNTVLAQAGPNLKYSFPDAADVRYLEIAGRDHRLAFRGTEMRGVEFTIPVIVQDDPTTRGVAVFDSLRALMEADIPYVCAMDPWGNRFLVDLAVPTGSQRGDVDMYLSELRLTTVTDVAAVAS